LPKLSTYWFLLPRSIPRSSTYARRWLARLADERTLTLRELDLAVTGASSTAFAARRGGAAGAFMSAVYR
jgi:hypothetical protein